MQLCCWEHDTAQPGAIWLVQFDADAVIPVEALSLSALLFPVFLEAQHLGSGADEVRNLPDNGHRAQDIVDVFQYLQNFDSVYHQSVVGRQRNAARTILAAADSTM